MNKKDLIALGVSEEISDQVIVLHGKDIESHKGKVSTAQAEIDGLKAQLTEAATTIEGFKKLDVDGIKAAADDWKAKAEKAQTDAAAQIAQVKFDHALEAALTGAKAKNAKAVEALLSKDALKLKDDGIIDGLDAQLEKIKSENDYLFADATPAPVIVKGGNNQTILDDPMLISMRKGAGLSIQKG